MRIDRTLAATIKRAITEKIGHRRCEVGRRETPSGADSFNSLLWAEDADLDDLWPLHGMTRIEIDHKALIIELDVYCYHYEDDMREGWGDLDQNVSVFLRGREVLAVLSTGELMAGLDAQYVGAGA